MDNTCNNSKSVFKKLEPFKFEEKIEHDTITMTDLGNCRPNKTEEAGSNVDVNGSLITKKIINTKCFLLGILCRHNLYSYSGLQKISLSYQTRRRENKVCKYSSRIAPTL
jgi:hypothetical protein